MRFFGGADGEPLCIQQRQEAAFEASARTKKKKKQLELSFLQILQMNSHANRHTQLIFPYPRDKDGEKKREKCIAI